MWIAFAHFRSRMFRILSCSALSLTPAFSSDSDTFVRTPEAGS